MTRTTTLVLVAALALGLFCAGCTKFTRERYETIYVGQPQFEVEATLGEPYARFSDTWTYINEKPFYKAIIQFKEGRVSDKAWADERVIEDHPDGKKPAGPGGSTTIRGSGTVVQ
ncbi:MAG: hypothetical protein BWX88_04289 [Planctomycetes bacterium ADurb.Bin126]|nr:MAG: hypothetical protein BWX88_04289 [Planctomycetes bacterium ADurb.Bin126]